MSAAARLSRLCSVGLRKARARSHAYNRGGVITAFLNGLLYFPSRGFHAKPADAGLDHEDMDFQAEDGVRLHGWWIRSNHGPGAAHVLLAHGNAGNIGDRVLHAKLLADAGLDVFLFDYRGYGKSEGRPDEEGTYRDA